MCIIYMICMIYMIYMIYIICPRCVIFQIQHFRCVCYCATLENRRGVLSSVLYQVRHTVHACFVRLLVYAAYSLSSSPTLTYIIPVLQCTAVELGVKATATLTPPARPVKNALDLLHCPHTSLGDKLLGSIVLRGKREVLPLTTVPMILT